MKEKPEDLSPRMLKNHHAITIVLGAEAEVDDPDLHHHNTTIAHDMEEAKGPNLQDIRTTTKMTKYKWERHALLAKFVGRQCPKYSSYPMINKNTMGHKNHSYGRRIICKQ
jgi:hypothetical protein